MISLLQMEELLIEKVRMGETRTEEVRIEEIPLRCNHRLPELLSSVVEECRDILQIEVEHLLPTVHVQIIGHLLLRISQQVQLLGQQVM